MFYALDNGSFKHILNGKGLGDYHCRCIGIWSRGMYTKKFELTENCKGIYKFSVSDWLLESY